MAEKHQLIAESIRQQADNVLQSKNIRSIIEKYGNLYFTGSYELDLMTWNDIDMQLVLNPGTDAKKVLQSIGYEISQDQDFRKLQLVDFVGDYKDKMPRGHYLGLYLDCKDLGGMWKLDLWCLSEKDFTDNREFVKKVQYLLRPESRDLILELKHEMMQGIGRVPKMGSFAIYQAVLIQGLHDKHQIYEYLNG